MYKFHVICLVFVLVRVKHFLHEGFLHVFFKSMFCFLIKANFLLLFCVFVNWNGGLDKYIFLYVYLSIYLYLSIYTYIFLQYWPRATRMYSVRSGEIQASQRCRGIYIGYPPSLPISISNQGGGKSLSKI